MTTRLLSRRELLRRGAAGAGLAAAQAALPAWMPRLAFAPPYEQPRGDVLISVFLRGGADMLNMIVPHGDEDYYTARPQLAIPRPDAGSGAGGALDLDGFFGLHPALAPLLPLFQAGQMSAVHAAGTPHHSRSHFVAMDFVERGALEASSITSGWIGRYLATLGAGESPLRAVGWGTAVQSALRGPVSAVAIQSIADFHLGGDSAMAARMMTALDTLYPLDGGALAAAARGTQEAMALVAQIGYADYRPQHGAVYPETDFALALRQTAALIRAQVGLEAACIDLGGWDTHVAQGGVEGEHAGLMTVLAEGLAAFHHDMGPEMSGVSLVVMSEFGRRVEENGGAGTDHGAGGALLALSGGLAAPPVFSRWPGLAPEQRDAGEDLAITTDYRDVLAELLTQRLGSRALADIFPDHTPTAVGLFRAR